jgi:hypothetical protein
MTNLKEMIVVRDITIDEPNRYFAPQVQMKFYAELKLGQAEEGWPVSIDELPDVQSHNLSPLARIFAADGLLKYEKSCCRISELRTHIECFHFG